MAGQVTKVTVSTGLKEESELEKLWKLHGDAMKQFRKQPETVSGLTDNLHLPHGILDPKDVDVVTGVCKEYKDKLRKGSMALRPSRRWSGFELATRCCVHKE